jgi:hypothetical protein
MRGERREEKGVMAEADMFSSLFSPIYSRVEP